MTLEPQIDFTCHKCGKECPVAPDPPKRAVCEDCCENHIYQYDRDFREWRCILCDRPADPDFWAYGD